MRPTPPSPPPENVDDGSSRPESGSALPLEDLPQDALRGARRGVVGAIFYLVDLRDARYDHAQLAWFRRCRAILETPVL